MSTETQQQDGADVGGGEPTLTVTDNRTGKQYEIPIEDNTIRATELRKIKVDEDDFGLMTYDPAYMATASCRSAITFIDGEKGILEYRGYPIEQLAEQSNYLEVSYLLIHGHLPSQPELDEWTHEITIHTFVHENVKEFMQGFRYDAHPMGMLLASVGALSTFYPEAAAIKDEAARYIQVIRLLAKMPTLAAFSYRHNRGMPYVYPDNDLSYAGNFLSMIYKMTELRYEPDPRLEHALDVLFILHADHEQNCSTSAVRSVGSSQVDPYSAVAAGVAALYGPLHGGANEAVLRMLARIETKENIPDFIQGVKDGKEKLMGFGHRVYKNFDPRAKIIKHGDRGGVRGDGQEPAARHRHRAREDRPGGRLLRRAQAVPERRLLLRPDLRGARDAGRDVPGAVRHRAHERLDRPVARDDRRQGAEDRSPAADLHRAAPSGATSPWTSGKPPAAGGFRRRGGVRGATQTHVRPTYGDDMDIVRLHTGRRVIIRPIRPTDAAELAAAYERLSPEAKYLRFMAAKPHLNETETRYLVGVDGRDHVALVAAPADRPERIVAVARFVRLRQSPDVAELAIVVGDDYQHDGLGSALMTRLASAATAQGVRRLRATMLAENVGMHRLARDLPGRIVREEHQGLTDEIDVELEALRVPRAA